MSRSQRSQRSSIYSVGPSSSLASSPFYGDRRPPPDLGRWANFKRYLWNRDQKTICGRTGVSWCGIISFYLIFLMCLMGIFFGMTLGFTSYIRKHMKTPWVTKKDLMKDGHPGVGFVPNIAKSNSPLIWYSNDSTIEPMKASNYISFIDNYLSQYDKAERNQDKYSNCAIRKEKDKPCIFLRSDLGPCGKSDYGYKSKVPCFYLKLNHLPGWIPEYFRSAADFPADMPEPLKKHIASEISKKTIWIFCEGMNPHDAEHAGEFSYYPNQGFLGYYFPFTTDALFVSPIIAVQMMDIKAGFVINIRCSAWAKNINPPILRDRSAEIQLFIDVYPASN